MRTILSENYISICDTKKPQPHTPRLPTTTFPSQRPTIPSHLSPKPHKFDYNHSPETFNNPKTPSSHPNPKYTDHSHRSQNQIYYKPPKHKPPAEGWTHSHHHQRNHNINPSQNLTDIYRSPDSTFCCI